MHPLSKKNVKLLLDTISNTTYARVRDYTIAITILDCGIRIGELLQTKIDDINFKEHYLIVRGSVSKTRTERILPLSNHTLKFLEQLCDISIGENRDEVFLSTTGLCAVPEQTIQLNFRRYKLDAGITVKCTPYVLRHTFATEMVKKGMDIFTLQKIMGHTNITTTRQYVQIDDTTMMKKHRESSPLDAYLK
ncbi:MAG: site-specific integrase [Clostridia bacterium]|nr:site-specific integrase [Clostridia bacterium]